ncbi:MAG: GAF domain-containing protein [Saccharothrix sp.]|nr:GAF domain-containing protein [Saccharothrix sp.]
MEGAGDLNAAANRRLVDHLLLVGASVVSAGSFAIGVLAGSATGTSRVLLIVAGSVLAVAAIVLGAWEKRRANRAQRSLEQIALDAEENLTVTLNAALAPITENLAKLAATTSRAARATTVGAIQQAIVSAAVSLTQPPGQGRSAYYTLEAGGTALVRVTYAGRATRPRERFEAGTVDGDRVLDVVNRRDYMLIDDVRAHAGVTPSGDGYNTVIAVSVFAEQRVLGMLAVDGPTAGSMTSTHVEQMKVLANLLAIALAGV